MGKGNAFQNDLMRLYFHGTPIAMVADNAAAPFTGHVLALHVADPGVGGSQSINEAVYAGYSRKTVPRSAVGWTISGHRANLASSVSFGACTASPGPPITYWSVSRGSGIIDYVGTLVYPIVMAIGVNPRLTPASEITEE